MGCSADGSYGSSGPSLRPTDLPVLHEDSLTRITRIARHGRMSRRVLVVLVAVVSILASPQAATADQTPLARKLAKALQAPHVSQSRTGALAVDLTTGLPVYSHNLALPLIPASNEKLAVTY